MIGSNCFNIGVEHKKFSTNNRITNTIYSGHSSSKKNKIIVYDDDEDEELNQRPVKRAKNIFHSETNACNNVCNKVVFNKFVFNNTVACNKVINKVVCKYTTPWKFYSLWLKQHCFRVYHISILKYRLKNYIPMNMTGILNYPVRNRFTTEEILLKPMIQIFGNKKEMSIADFSLQHNASLQKLTSATQHLVRLLVFIDGKYYTLSYLLYCLARDFSIISKENKLKSESFLPVVAPIFGVCNPLNEEIRRNRVNYQFSNDSGIMLLCDPKFTKHELQLLGSNYRKFVTKGIWNFEIEKDIITIYHSSQKKNDIEFTLTEEFPVMESNLIGFFDECKYRDDNLAVEYRKQCLEPTSPTKHIFLENISRKGDIFLELCYQLTDSSGFGAEESLTGNVLPYGFVINYSCFTQNVMKSKQIVKISCKDNLIVGFQLSFK